MWVQSILGVTVGGVPLWVIVLCELVGVLVDLEGNYW